MCLAKLMGAIKRIPLFFLGPVHVVSQAVQGYYMPTSTQWGSIEADNHVYAGTTCNREQEIVVPMGAIEDPLIMRWWRKNMYIASKGVLHNAIQ